MRNKCRLATSKVDIPKGIDVDSLAKFDLENEDSGEIEDGSISEEEEEEVEYLVDTTQMLTTVNETVTELGPQVKKGWRRVRKIYSRSKQYIFIAATLPVNGKKTAEDFRNICFQMLFGLKQKCEWVEVTLETQVDALIEAVSNNNNNNSNTERTMVFAYTVEGVEAVADMLKKASIQCYRYHKNSPLKND